MKNKKAFRVAVSEMKQFLAGATLVLLLVGIVPAFAQMGMPGPGPMGGDQMGGMGMPGPGPMNPPMGGDQMGGMRMPEPGPMNPPMGDDQMGGMGMRGPGQMSGGMNGGQNGVQGTQGRPNQNMMNFPGQGKGVQGGFPGQGQGVQGGFPGQEKMQFDKGSNKGMNQKDPMQKGGQIQIDTGKYGKQPFNGADSTQFTAPITETSGETQTSDLSQTNTSGKNLIRPSANIRQGQQFNQNQKQNMGQQQNMFRPKMQKIKKVDQPKLKKAYDKGVTKISAAKTKFETKRAAATTDRKALSLVKSQLKGFRSLCNSTFNSFPKFGMMGGPGQGPMGGMQGPMMGGDQIGSPVPPETFNWQDELIPDIQDAVMEKIDEEDYIGALEEIGTGYGTLNEEFTSMYNSLVEYAGDVDEYNAEIDAAPTTDYSSVPTDSTIYPQDTTGGFSF